jgi:quinol monooxygenase YgiN
MQDISRCLLIAPILAVTLAHFAHAQSSAIYVTTYVEVMANAIAPGVSLLEAYSDASRKQDGNLRFNVLQEIGRPNRFAIIEAWRDPGALDAHAKAASTLDFRRQSKRHHTTIESTVLSPSKRERTQQSPARSMWLRMLMCCLPAKMIA